jgi:hypothetical protein
MSTTPYGTLFETTSSASYIPGQVVFKVVLEKGATKEPEVRRVRGNFKFDEMVTIVRHMWNSAPKRITIEYIDEDNDRIRVGSELEWNEAIQQHVDRGQVTALRLFVRRGRRCDRKRGMVDDSSDSEADTAPAPVAPVAPVIPPLMVERALSSLAVDQTQFAIPDVEPMTVEQDEYTPVPEAPVVPPFTCGMHESALVAADDDALSREHEATIDLLSRLYDCDAAKEMLDMFSRVDFSPVVARRVDAVAQEVHVDVDKIALRHLTVTRTNLWIGNGLHEKAETTLSAALAVWPNDAILEYNLACAASLRGNAVKAVEYLRAAVAHGYRNAQQMKRDPDLARAREHADFATVLDLARGFAAPRSMPTVAAVEPAVPAPEEPAPVAPASTVPPAPQAPETDVDRLLAVFPHLTTAEAAGLLRRFGDLSTAVNHCLTL